MVQGACPTLHTVDAQFCHVLGSEAVCSMAACMPALCSLLLPYCTAVGTQGLAALAAMQHLHTLDLSFTNLKVGAPTRCEARRGNARMSRTLQDIDRTRQPKAGQGEARRGTVIHIRQSQGSARSADLVSMQPASRCPATSLLYSAAPVWAIV